MRQPQELSKGQITPQARGIDAFLSPKDRQLAAPNQPSLMPAPSQFTTVSTAGTQGISTKNSFARLAEDLGDFSPKLLKTAQSLGLAYVDSEIRKGEEAAREAATRALALNDAQMEGAELAAAADTRRVARKDPQAGQFMASLNPYFSMGYQRGMVKKAGLEASAGLPAFFQRKNAESPINYTAPDMGMGQLVQWQAEYTNQLANEYGIDASSPGFQKYFLKSIEKAREDFNQTFLDDRKDFFDKAAVKSTTGQLLELFNSSERNGFVEYQGQKYYRSQNPAAFELVRSNQAQMLVDAGVLTASLPGEANERSENIYKGLVQAGYFNNNEELVKFANGIAGNARVIGPDGKAIIGVNGQPLVLSWGDQFGEASIDQQIKYEEKGFKVRQAQNLDRSGGFEDQLLDVATQYPPGPEQRLAIDNFVTDYYTNVGRPAGITKAELLKRTRSLLKEDDAIFYEQGNARPADIFAEKVSGMVGDNFDATALRRELFQVANTLPPEERSSFISQQSARIRQKENDQRSMSGYKGTRDAVIRQAVKARREQYYDFGRDIYGNPRTNRDDIAESDRRQTNAYTARANALIMRREADLGRPLTDAETRQVTNAAIYGDRDLGIAPYGDGKQTGPGSLNDLFPGSNKTSTPGASGSSSQGVGLGGIGGVSSSVLRNHRSQPVFSSQGVLDAFDAIDSTRPLPAALRKAAKDSGARNTADFVLQQMEVWRQRKAASGAPQTEIDKFTVPFQKKTELRKRWQNASAAGQTPVAYAASQRSTPNLASAGNWALNALTGSTAATAGELPPGYESFSRPNRQTPVRPSQPVVASAPRGSSSGSTGPARLSVVPAAPVLPPAPAEVASAQPQQQSTPTRPAEPGWVGTAPAPVGELKETKVRGFYTDEQGNLFRWQDPTPRGWSTMNYASQGQGSLRPRRRVLGLGSTGDSWESSDQRGQQLIAMAGRLGVDPADLAAIFSFETGGTLDPNQPGYGAAAGRIGLIQAGPGERSAYGLGQGTWQSEMRGVENYLRDRGVRPGMGLPDLYATVNGGNPKAGYTADGNGTVARSAQTQRLLREHREAAIRKLGLRRPSP